MYFQYCYYYFYYFYDHLYCYHSCYYYYYCYYYGSVYLGLVNDLFRYTSKRASCKLFLLLLSLSSLLLLLLPLSLMLFLLLLMFQEEHFTVFMRWKVSLSFFIFINRIHTITTWCWRTTSILLYDIIWLWWHEDKGCRPACLCH